MKQKKHSVVFVYGCRASETYESEGFMEMCKVLEEGDGTLVKRTFDTEAEVRAYQQAVEDSFGWDGCYCIDEDDIKAHPRLVKKYC